MPHRSIISSIAQKIPLPAAPLPCSCCILVIYCLLTVFHAAMYFSIHWVKQVVSLLDNEEPGLGTHFSKQCSLTFCRRVSEIVEIVDQAGQTSINCLAFV